MDSAKKQILLTNDDGIESPGVWAAAEALSALGFVTVAAPRQQFSGAGRSHPIHSDGVITPRQLQIGRQIWTAYAVGGSPAQSVVYAVLDLLPQRPDLIVSGINYGENLGHCISSSGTVGAALEGAAFGIPSMAVSLQITDGGYLSYSSDVKFASAAYFTALFRRAHPGRRPAAGCTCAQGGRSRCRHAKNPLAHGTPGHGAVLCSPHRSRGRSGWNQHNWI